MGHLVQCRGCGVTFEARNRTTKSCSRECSAKRGMFRVFKSKKQDRSNLRTDPRLIVEPLPGEEWRPTVHNANYCVSNLGRICSLDYIRSNDKIIHGRLLKPGTNHSGHRYVFLGRTIRKLVHVLVLESFVGPCPPRHEGLHFDDDPSNNRLDNLRWGTRSENLKDGIRNGKIAIGEAKPQAKLNEDSVRWIRANSHCSMNSLAMHLGVTCQAVRQVRLGITWKHVV